MVIKYLARGGFHIEARGRKIIVVRDKSKEVVAEFDHLYDAEMFIVKATEERINKMDIEKLIEESKHPRRKFAG